MDAREEPVDVWLESSGAATRRLSELRGKVVVLFWEARERQSDNAALKDELGRLGLDARLAREVAVVAVGDVSGYDFAPARAIVRGAISAIARVMGIEIWFDWKGALGEPPFSLRRGQSNVMVLDREGRPVLRLHGALGPLERRGLVLRVRSMLGGRADFAA